MRLYDILEIYFWTLKHFNGGGQMGDAVDGVVTALACLVRVLP